MGADLDRLLELFSELHAATVNRDHLEQRLRDGDAADDVVERSLWASEDVLAARAALLRALLALGWVPPPRVAQQLALDERLLNEPDGAVPG